MVVVDKATEELSISNQVSTNNKFLQHTMDFMFFSGQVQFSQGVCGDSVLLRRFGFFFIRDTTAQEHQMRMCYDVFNLMEIVPFCIILIFLKQLTNSVTQILLLSPCP